MNKLTSPTPGTPLLLLEDHALSRESLAESLGREGYQVAAFGTGGEALAHLEAARAGRIPMPELAVLDLGLPDMDGLDVLRHVRGEGFPPGLGVILLTAKAEEVDRVVGLELGADDYVAKPYSSRELVARLKAVGRRAHPLPTGLPTLARGPLAVNLARFSASVSGEAVDLTRRELELLIYFLQHPGELLTRERLLKEVWGLQHPGDGRTVDVHMRRLRRKLGEAAAPLTTVIGAGYRLD